MNTCSICKHSKRAGIEAALAHGESLRDIAGQFSVSKSAVERHQECVSELLSKARKQRDLQLTRDLDGKFNRALALAERLVDACDEYLTDPEDHNKYFIGPRAEDVQIVYTTTPSGAKPVRAKATLAALLERVEKSPRMRGFALEHVTIRTADPRDLILKVIDRLERLTARIKGLDRPPRVPRIDLVAIKMLEMEERGTPVEREEAERLVTEETAEFERRLLATGQDLTALGLF